MNLRRPDEGMLTRPRDLIDLLSGYYDALMLLLGVRTTIVTATLAAGDNFVPHALGHAVVTWEVLDKSATADIWRSATANAAPNQFLILQASAAVTVKLRLS